MDLADQPISHSARADMFQREATWRLGPDALEREGGEPADAPWWARLSRFHLRLIMPWAIRSIEPQARIRASSTRYGGSARFPYASICELRLCFDPIRADDTRHRCDIRLADRQKASFYSTHFVGFSEFEDRAASYTALIRELAARVARANPSCGIRAGKRPIVYWTEHIVLLALAALLVFVLALVGGVAITDLFLVKLGVIVAFIPVMIAYTRKTRPGSFDPKVLPEKVLPGG